MIKNFSNKKYWLCLGMMLSICLSNGKIIASDSLPELDGKRPNVASGQGALSGNTIEGSIEQTFNEGGKGGTGGGAVVHNHIGSPSLPPIERQKRPDEYFSQGEAYGIRKPPYSAEAMEAYQYAANVTPPHILACIRCAEHFHSITPADINNVLYYYERALSTEEGSKPQKAYQGLMKLHYEVAINSGRKKTKEINLKKAKDYGDLITVPTTEDDVMLENIEELLSQLGILSGEAVLAIPVEDVVSMSPVAISQKMPGAIASGGGMAAVKMLSPGARANLEDGPDIKKLIEETKRGIRASREQIIELATNGNVECQLCLGDLYREGVSVDGNHQEAMRWYLQAVDQGNAEGQFKVGSMYAYGHGVTIDKIKAKRLYNLAASQGHVEATGRLKIPEIAWGYEEVYKRFLRGVLIYNKDQAGERRFPISDFANPLEGEFNLSGLTFEYESKTYNVDQYLRIKLGYRKAKENEDKTTIWIAPKFVVDGTSSSFKSVPWSAPVGAFWTWGRYDLDSFDYVTNTAFDIISSKNLYALRVGCVVPIMFASRWLLWIGAGAEFYLHF